MATTRAKAAEVRGQGREGATGEARARRPDVARVRRGARRARRAQGTRARGPSRGQDLKLTNLDKVLFPPRDGRDEAPRRRSAT